MSNVVLVVDCISAHKGPSAEKRHVWFNCMF